MIWFPNFSPNGTLRGVNSRFLLILIVLLFCPPLMAQQTDMKVWLNSETKEERTRRLVSLGVERDTADEITSPTEHTVGWLPIRSEKPQEYAILFLPCGLDLANLYLMKSDGREWHVSDHVELDCHYDGTVSVEISPIRKSMVDEVLVHHASVAHGTGLSQQNFRVFDVVSEKLRVVLDVEEAIVASAVPVGSRELFQQSVFVTIPTAGSQSRAIEETRSITLNGRRTVQRRVFRWDESKGRYQPSRFTGVEAVDK